MAGRISIDLTSALNLHQHRTCAVARLPRHIDEERLGLVGRDQWLDAGLEGKIRPVKPDHVGQRVANAGPRQVANTDADHIDDVVAFTPEEL